MGPGFLCPPWLRVRLGHSCSTVEGVSCAPPSPGLGPHFLWVWGTGHKGEWAAGALQPVLHLPSCLVTPVSSFLQPQFPCLHC